MTRSLCLAAALALSALAPAAMAQPASRAMASVAALRTAAERSGYAETTRHADVLAFLDTLARHDPWMRKATLGYSVEGRRLPLVVWGDVAAATPDAVRAARASGKAVVFVMANIHAGEVEGKEAMLAMLREMTLRRPAGWAERLVVLVAPIYNADGNERVRLDNRPLQLGPVGGMGQRPNAQDLDLNRDMMKLASPEARALVTALTAYAPDVLVDLHTTNGSSHAYHLTYAPGLSPDTPPAIDAYLRTDLLPAVTNAVRAATGYEIEHYGNLEGAFGETGGPRGWTTFDYRPRFVTNYAGLTGRLSILSEAYSYAPFDERIRATDAFVRATLDRVASDAPRVRALVDAAAATPPATFATSATFAPPVTRTILLDDATEEPHPYTGAMMLRRAGRPRPTPMPVRDAFVAAETAALPAAYLVPEALKPIFDRLAVHGIETEAASGMYDVERFVVDSSRQAPRPFQGVRERTVAGHYESARVDGAGYRLVRLSDGRARLAAALLDPRAPDGFTVWALFDAALAASPVHPVLRVVR